VTLRRRSLARAATSDRRDAKTSSRHALVVSAITSSTVCPTSIFAVSMMALAGTWAVIEGIAAIANSKVFVANSTFVFSNLHTWGWIVLGLGTLLLLSAFTVFTGSQFARWFGIFAAGLNAIGQLFFIQAYPLWSMGMFAADIVIIYALATYAGPKLKKI
jgi:hypothetical protein